MPVGGWRVRMVGLAFSANMYVVSGLVIRQLTRADSVSASNCTSTALLQLVVNPSPPEPETARRTPGNGSGVTDQAQPARSVMEPKVRGEAALLVPGLGGMVGGSSIEAP